MMPGSHLIRRSLVCFVLFACNSFSLATYSILAIDRHSQEVGSAMATCLIASDPQGGKEVFNPMQYMNLSLAKIALAYVPHKGIIHLQAWTTDFLQRLAQARRLLQEDRSARDINQILLSQDSMKEGRQHALLIFGNQPGTESYTGKGVSPAAHTLRGHSQEGRYVYVLAGNTLTKKAVLEMMQQAFESTDGPIEKKLANALKAVAHANEGDSRCRPYKISATSAYLRVYNAQGDIRVDVFENSPSTPFHDAALEMVRQLKKSPHARPEEHKIFPGKSAKPLPLWLQ